jgi:hypothetical protein
MCGSFGSVSLDWGMTVHLGVDQQCAFDDIKKYLSSPPVMKAHIAGIPFRLYITAKDAIIGAILTQVIDGKEHVITYLSRCLIDAKTRYSFIKKLCLSLFYVCSKLQHYLLPSTCIVACQADVIRHMLQQLILIGRIGKWAYSLIEYYLAYEPLKSMKGQVVEDFMLGIVWIKIAMNHVIWCQFVHGNCSLMARRIEKAKV